MRMQRAVVPEHEEDIWCVGGARGMVTLNVMTPRSGYWGQATALTVHSPAEVPDWGPPVACPRLEGPCWYMGSAGSDQRLAVMLDAMPRDGGEEAWRLMEMTYEAYFGGGR